MSSADKVLELLDAGLQSTTEPNLGWESDDIDPERCVRCQRAERQEGGDFCAECRLFLLGDTDTDPATDAGPTTVTVAAFLRRNGFESLGHISWGDDPVVRATEARHRQTADVLLEMRRTVGTAAGSDPAVHEAVVEERARFVAADVARTRREMEQAWTHMLDVMSSTGAALAEVFTRISEAADVVIMSIGRSVGRSEAQRLWSGPTFPPRDFRSDDRASVLVPRGDELAEALAEASRERNRAFLAEMRRRHRRTNRWGPPPGGS